MFSGVTKPVTLLIGDANFTITVQQVIAGDDIHIIGTADSTFTRGAAIDPFSITGDNVVLNGFTIEGNSAGFAGVNDLVVLSTANGCRIRNVTFNDSTRRAIFAATTTDCRVEDNTFTNNDGTTVLFEKNSHRNIFSHNFWAASNGDTAGAELMSIHSTTAGQTADENIISDNVMFKDGSGGFAVEIGSFGGNSPTRNVVSGNVIVLSGSTPAGGISIADSDDGIISGNTISGPATIAHIELATEPTGNMVVGNRSQGSTNRGIIVAGSNNVISSNSVKD